MEHDFALENFYKSDPLLKTNSRLLICKNFDLHSDYFHLESDYVAFQQNMGSILEENVLYTYVPNTYKLEKYRDISKIETDKQ